MKKPKMDKWGWLLAAAVLAFLSLFVYLTLWSYPTTAAVLLGLSVFCFVRWLLRRKKVARILLTALLCVAIGMVAAAEIPVLVASRGDEEADAPYLVVLGAGLNGSYPSYSLIERLVAAEDYLKAHPDTVAILSGGQGPGEDITEAQGMCNWLVARGIDRTRLVLEERSTSTEENLRLSFDIIRERGDDPAEGVAIVSSEYHLYRAKLMAKKLGATPYGVAGHTTYFTLRANYMLREAFAVWFLWVFGI